MAGLLNRYGFDRFGEYPELENRFYGRITSQAKGLYKAVTDEGELFCEISGKLRYDSMLPEEFPAVGDFVVLDRNSSRGGHAIIHQILPRKSSFVRNASGALNEAQVVAANIDYAFICTSLNQDFNLKRLERYITLAWNNGTTPVVVLTKADLCEDIDSKLAAVDSVAIGVKVLLTSSVDEDGLEEIEEFLQPGMTIALMGSSGVGKSTIINRLQGTDSIETFEVRNDDKGRHTTTQRQMYLLENGCILIDTPGMRELGLTSETEDLSQSFEDVEQYFGQCKFRNCTHTSEPGCAVFRAIRAGELSEKRWNSYNKLKEEQAFAQDKAGYVHQKDMLLLERSKRRRAVREKKGH